MKRRGNKSNKVPNVKLRPAHPDNSSRQSCLAEDTQPCDLGGSSTLDLCPRPFKGVVLCATGIIDKPTLFKQAIELGATSTNAFTDRVTHLVAEDHGSAKYTCALERKIPLLKPSWITENYQIWLRGDDVDLNDSVEKHRLPIFSGVIMSLSGISDVTKRTQIHTLLTQQDGVYVKNLERPVKVTHLLCSGDEETDKMRYANKFNARGEASIRLVWEEWFWDSLEFGGRFDEGKYQVQCPRPGRKVIPEAPSSSPSSEVPPPESTPPSSSAPNNSQDQDDDEEVASIKRLPDVTLQVWASLLRPRGFEIAGGKLVRSPSAQRRTGLLPEQASPVRLPSSNNKGKGSIISSFRRANSFAPQPKDPTPKTSQPFRRTSTLPALPAVANNGESSTAAVASCPSLFAGLKFVALGEARCPNVRAAIEGSGGLMVSEADDDVDYIVVRLVSGSKLFREESDERLREKYRTESWLELCIYHERICSPDENMWFTPLKIVTPVPGAEDIRLSLSGFDESESWPIRRLIRALGIIQLPNFCREATHLLCPSGKGAKFQKALEWDVPVVKMQWLENMARTGVICSAAPYLVSDPSNETSGGELVDGMDVFMDLIPVNKGKERENDLHRMANITNGSGRTHDKHRSQDMGFCGSKSVPDDPAVRRVTGLTSQLTRSLDSQPLPSMTSMRASLEYLAEQSSTLHSPTRHVGPSRQRTLDEQEMHVPSSKSPSPMKMPGDHQRELTLSPVKVSNEVTRALQDNITSLLGKRQTSEDDLFARNGKRPRPHTRSKPQSRQASKATIASQSDHSPRSKSPPAPVGEYDAVSVDDTGGDESIRVVYEDPWQMDEKKRLMNLLGGQSQKAP